MKVLYDHTTPETAYTVNDYPWGYVLKTQRKFWIETTKNGDRLVLQTLNPKTNKWCKEKKSTYSDVKLLCLADNGHVSTIGWTPLYTDLKDLESFLSKIDENKLNDQQKKRIERGRRIYEIRDHIDYKITRKEA